MNNTVHFFNEKAQGLLISYEWVIDIYQVQNLSMIET